MPMPVMTTLLMINDVGFYYDNCLNQLIMRIGGWPAIICINSPIKYILYNKCGLHSSSHCFSSAHSASLSSNSPNSSNRE